MTRLEERSELSVRWSEWLLRRNQRGMRRMLWIGLCLSPTLGVLDAMLAPERWLPGLKVMRGSAMLLTLALFPAVPSAVFRRYPNAISAGYVLLVVLGYLAPNLAINEAHPVLTVSTPFLLSTAVIAGTGQMLAFRSRRPSIVITDWMMPKLDGLELTRQLRHDPKTRHIPIVMLSARSDLDDNTTKQAGHGMGLGPTITRRVVVGLGGSLRLESELGKGSEFIIRVPSSLGCREAAS